MLLGCALVDVRQRRCSASVSIRPMRPTSKSLRIRPSRRWFGRSLHRPHSFAASTPAASAPCCTPSADQFPIEPAEPGAPIPRLPSLAGFERRPRSAWQRSRWAGVRNPLHLRTPAVGVCRAVVMAGIRKPSQVETLRVSLVPAPDAAKRTCRIDTAWCARAPRRRILLAHLYFRSGRGRFYRPIKGLRAHAVRSNYSR